MKPTDRVRLRHVLDALTSAIRFTEARRREDLEKDEMLTFALVYAVQIVGEAVSKVSVEFREQHPEIPWAIIIGMRNRSGACLFRYQPRHPLDHGHRGGSRAAGADQAATRARQQPVKVEQNGH